MGQMVKNLPTVQEIQVWSLGQEDHWKRRWLPTPVFLSGEFHGQRSLARYSPCARTVRNDWGTNTSLTSNTIQLRLDSQPSYSLNGFSCGWTGKESACSVVHLGSMPGLGRSPGEGKGYPLQYSGLENSMDWLAHGVAKSYTTERLTLSQNRHLTKLKLSTKELMLWNCGAGEDSWESLGLQGDPTSPSWRRSVLGVLWKE